MQKPCKKKKVYREINWLGVRSFRIYCEAQTSKTLHYALLSPMKSAHKCQFASSSLITKIKQSLSLHFICWATQILYSIWRHTGRNHFTEHYDATIYGTKSGNKPLKQDCLIHGGWAPTVQRRIGPGHQDDISLPSQPLLEGLSRPSTDFMVRCHPLGPGKRLGGGTETENTWHCNTNQDMWIHSSHGLSESTEKYELLSTGSRAGKCPPSGGFTLLHRQM